MSNCIPNLEPLILSIGDTLAFNKNFPNYLPSAGWSLEYQIRGGAGKAAGLQDIKFVSTPDATNTYHQISVLPAATAVWSIGEYVLAGYAVNATANPPARHEIYQATILLSPNLDSPTDNVNVQTFAQQSVCALEKVYISMVANYLLETNVQQTLIIREKRDAIRKELLFWYEKRANEVAIENVRNGRPSGQKIKPVMNVIGVGQGFLYGQGYPYFPNGG